MLVLSVFQYALLVATAAGILYYVACLIAAAVFFLRASKSKNSQFPPVTLMVPLCGEDVEAFENFSSLCRLDYPDYQIVFGVRDCRDPSIRLIQRLTASFPDRDIRLVISADQIGDNLKVSNLQNMLAEVKHEYVVIIDSDIRVEQDYLRSIVPPLFDQRIGLVTCLYRSSRTPNLASRLEALGVSAEFMPGVLVSWLLEGVRFALGATMATTRSRLMSVGGFQVMANHIADDYILGHCIAKSGYQIFLAPYVVETVQPAASFSAMLKHQIRLMRGVRACRPFGHFGLFFSYGTVLALAFSITSAFSLPSLALLAGIILLRLCSGGIIGGIWLNDKVVRTYLWLLPLRDLIGFTVWIISLFGRKVEWRGEILELQQGGRIVRRSDSH